VAPYSPTGGIKTIDAGDQRMVFTEIDGLRVHYAAASDPSAPKGQRADCRLEIRYKDWIGDETFDVIALSTRF